jgi:diguanylate cyclase (GGDEF)-like protein
MVIGFGGLAWMTWSLRAVEVHDWGSVALFTVLTILAEWSHIQLLEGFISPSLAVLLPAAVLHGPGLAAAMGSVGFLAGHVLPVRRDWLATVFNLGQLAASLLAAGGAYTLLGGHIGLVTAPVVEVVPLAGLTISYFVVNHTLVGIYMSLRHRRIDWRLFWIEPARVDLATLAICVPIGVSVLMLYRVAGPLVADSLYVALFMGAHLLRVLVRLEGVNRELAALYEMTRELTGTLREDEVEKIAFRAASALVHYDRAVFLRWDPSIEQLVVARLVHPRADDLRGTRVRLGDALAGEVALAQEGRLVSDGRSQPGTRLFPTDEVIGGSALAVPLVAEGRLVGVLAVSRSVPGALNKNHLRVMGILAGQLATAADRAFRYQEASRLAITDAKTGIFNYRYFYERLRDEMARADDLGTSVSLIFIDIDFLKEINDRYGHAMGDAAIQEVVRVIGQNIRTSDVAARYGGEEFVIALPGAEPAEALAVAERIRAAVERSPFGKTPEDLPILTTVSAGIATYPHDAEVVDDLIFRADEALYVGSKRRGRNRVAVYESLGAPSS